MTPTLFIDINPRFSDSTSRPSRCVTASAQPGLNAADMERPDDQRRPGAEDLPTQGSATGAGSNPGYLTEVDGGLFFITDSTVFPAPTPASYEVWHSDGTVAGTTMLKSFEGLVAPHKHNGLLLFGGYKPASGYELWRSDGTVTGTFQLKDINPGASGSNPEKVAQVGDIFYFTADDGVSGRELWRTDGTISGTFQLKDIRPGVLSSVPFVTDQLGGLLFFDADDGVSGREPWRTDGTISGTFRLKDIRAGGGGSLPVARSSIAFAGKVFFAADDGASGMEIWMSDGTITGTSLLRDLRPGNSEPEFITVFSDTLLFTASNGGVERALWSSDGTADGTIYLNNISPWSQTIYINSSVVISDHAIFSAFNSEGAYQLWRSDGTAAGTVLLHGGTNGDSAYGSVPRYLTVLGDVLFFATSSQATKTTYLWCSDGTPGGTVKISDLPYDLRISRIKVHQGRVFLIATPNEAGLAPELWVSDGTPAGTGAITPATGEGGPFTAMTDLVSIGESLFVTITDDRGEELWIYDDSAGLRRWEDIALEASSSIPRELTLVGERLFFSADDTLHGRELWSSAPVSIAPTYSLYISRLAR
jgi:ELWxxDGT repeat protein